MSSSPEQQKGVEVGQREGGVGVSWQDEARKQVERVGMVLEKVVHKQSVVKQKLLELRGGFTGMHQGKMEMNGRELERVKEEFETFKNGLEERLRLLEKQPDGERIEHLSDWVDEWRERIDVQQSVLEGVDTDVWRVSQSDALKQIELEAHVVGKEAVKDEAKWADKEFVQRHLKEALRGVLAVVGGNDATMSSSLAFQEILRTTGLSTEELLSVVEQQKELFAKHVEQLLDKKEKVPKTLYERFKEFDKGWVGASVLGLFVGHDVLPVGGALFGLKLSHEGDERQRHEQAKTAELTKAFSIKNSVEREDVLEQMGVTEAEVTDILATLIAEAKYVQIQNKTQGSELAWQQNLGHILEERFGLTGEALQNATEAMIAFRAVRQEMMAQADLLLWHEQELDETLQTPLGAVLEKRFPSLITALRKKSPSSGLTIAGVGLGAAIPLPVRVVVGALGGYMSKEKELARQGEQADLQNDALHLADATWVRAHPREAYEARTRIEQTVQQELFRAKTGVEVVQNKTQEMREVHEKRLKTRQRQFVAKLAAGLASTVFVSAGGEAWKMATEPVKELVFEKMADVVLKGAEVGAEAIQDTVTKTTLLP